MSTEAEIKAVGDILLACDHPCIVDLGAFHGEDTRWMVDLVAEKHPRAIMVEPDPWNCDFLLITGFPKIATVIRGAISDHTGTCDFWACYTAEGRGSGSIHRPVGILKSKPWYDFQKIVDPVACYSLDSIFWNHGLDHIDVLWSDIQGAEKKMITGGWKALQHTRYMFIEAEEDGGFYEGQVGRKELLKMLPGWTVLNSFEQNLLLRNEYSS